MIYNLKGPWDNCGLDLLSYSYLLQILILGEVKQDRNATRSVSLLQSRRYYCWIYHMHLFFSHLNYFLGTRVTSSSQRLWTLFLSELITFFFWTWKSPPERNLVKKNLNFGWFSFFRYLTTFAHNLEGYFQFLLTQELFVGNFNPSIMSYLL